VDRAEELAVGLAQRAEFRRRRRDEDRNGRAGIDGERGGRTATGINANKKVRFSVASDTQRFTVRIADEGDGFDFSARLPRPAVQENLMRASGRGIFPHPLVYG